MNIPRRSLRLRSALVVAAVSAALATGITATPAQATTQQNCGVEGTVMFDQFYAHNSEWGNTYNGWGTGSQCVSHDDAAGGENWASSFSWANNPNISDDEWHIKAFPSVVDGWQWGYANADQGGFPVRLGDEHSIVTNWDFSINAGDWKGDSIYDMWVDPSQNPTSQPQNEVMVFLNYSDGAIPDSSAMVGTTTVDGESWNVYRSFGSWQVISFVRADQTSDVSNLDLRDFMDYGQNAGYLDPNLYLLGVQAGHEIWHGEGTTSTWNYNVTVN